MRIRPECEALAVEDGGDRVADLSASSGTGSPSPFAENAEPVEVPGQRERDIVDDLDRLEDPVADGEAVIEDRDRRAIRGRSGIRCTKLACRPP